MTVHPNLMGPPKTKHKLLTDCLPHHPFLTPHEAHIVAEKRGLGWPDAQIAKVLGCSIDLLRKNIVFDGNPEAFRPVTFTVKRKVPLITDDERRERNRAARSGTVWRAK